MLTYVFSFFSEHCELYKTPKFCSNTVTGFNNQILFSYTWNQNSIQI